MTPIQKTTRTCPECDADTIVDLDIDVNTCDICEGYFDTDLVR